MPVHEYVIRHHAQTDVRAFSHDAVNGRAGHLERHQRYVSESDTRINCILLLTLLPRRRDTSDGL
jgi:hypothetical protein